MSRPVPVSFPALARALAGALALLAAGSPRANDSEAAMGLGGLELKTSSVIRLDSEDLYISRDQVRVTYRFTNTSGAPVTTLIAFPLPDITPAPDQRVPDFLRDLNFTTTLDGKPLQLGYVQRASFKGADVTARLNALRIPLASSAEGFSPGINALPPQTRAALVKEGLVSEGGSDGKQTLWDAHWTLHTSITREQTFPIGTATVEHRYKPVAGGSVGGGLDRAHRAGPDFAATRRRYCVEDSILNAIDRRIAAPGTRYSEVWLSYVLKTGANWAGPIRDFRLVVDKGNPESLVSFCARGVRKLDATRFEVRYTDFVPREDLDILLVDFHRNE